MPLYMMARFGITNDFETAAEVVKRKSIEAGVEWRVADWSDMDRIRSWDELEADAVIE